MNMALLAEGTRHGAVNTCADRLGLHVLALAPLLLSAIAHGQSAIDFDHVAGGNVSRTMSVEDGEVIVINVTNTCPSRFDYEYVAYERPKADSDSKASFAAPNLEQCTVAATDEELLAFFDANAENVGMCGSETKIIRIPHQQKFGSYLIELTTKADATNPQKRTIRLFDKNKRQDLVAQFAAKAKEDVATAIKTKQEKPCDIVKLDALQAVSASSKLLREVKNASLIVSVEHTGWTYGIAGAFTLTSVTDPRFAIVPDESSTVPDAKLVIRDKQAEDDMGLGVAAMIHLYNPDLDGIRSKVALTFGLGVGEENEVSYFVGPSWRFGKQGFATLGVNFAPVDRLPAGQRLNKAPQSDNVLNDVGAKTEVGIFLGLSYSFLSPGEGAFKGALATKDTKAGTADTP